MSDTFPCANCGVPSTVLFQQVPVCSECHRVAVHRVEKMDQELDKLRKLHLEQLRLQIIQAKMPRKK